VYLQINFFGPIVANANKMVKIAKSGPQPIEVMDKLNEAGVTATTIGKSFAEHR
jgi:Na+/H+-translocating membrane pyrophosphatase